MLFFGVHNPESYSFDALVGGAQKNVPVIPSGSEVADTSLVAENSRFSAISMEGLAGVASAGFVDSTVGDMLALRISRSSEEGMGAFVAGSISIEYKTILMFIMRVWVSKHINAPLNTMRKRSVVRMLSLTQMV